MDWHQRAVKRFQKAVQNWRAGSSGDLQECIEDLDETLLIVFKGFLRENGIETGKRTLFAKLVEEMGRQPDVDLTKFMQKFCSEIHESRNRARYDSVTPDRKFAWQALGFVRCRMTELGVEIPKELASIGYDPLKRAVPRISGRAARQPQATEIVEKRAWIRLNDLCRELEVKVKVVLAALADMGVEERITHSNWVDRATADKLRGYFRGRKRSIS